MAPRSIPRIELYEVPEAMVALAKRRTEFVIEQIRRDVPMSMALAMAYMQGMNDVIDVIQASRP